MTQFTMSGMLATVIAAVSAGAQKPVDQQDTSFGPRIEIAITDELVLPQGESKAARDESGNLVTVRPET